MKEKKTVLVATYHLVEVEEDELVKEEGLLDNVMREISNDMELNVGEKVFLKWEGTSMVPLLPELNNCGRCSSCGAWTTDRDKEDPIVGLSNGAMVAERLLCEECFPEN